MKTSDSKTFKDEVIEIGQITYTFDCIVYFTEIYERGDYYSPDYSDTEIDEIQIDGKIHAYNNDTDEEYFVTDQKEIEMVLDWAYDIDFELYD